MQAESWGRQFRSQMGNTPYPFDDQATLTTADGLTLSQAAIADALIAPVGTWSQVALTQIVTSLGTATLWVGDELHAQVASVTIDPRGAPTQAGLFDTSGRPAGFFRFNPAAAGELQTWPDGTHKFPAGTANFIVSVVVPTPEVGIRGIRVGTTVFTDDVYLAGIFGVVLNVDKRLASYDINAIAVNAIGDPLFVRRDCLASGSFTAPSPLLTINNVGPGIHGEYLLLPAGFLKGGTALRIDPQGTDTLVVSVAGGGG